MMFGRACPLCSAETLDLMRHIAWHAYVDHDVTPEAVARVTELRATVEESFLAAQETTDA